MAAGHVSTPRHHPYQRDTSAATRRLSDKPPSAAPSKLIPHTYEIYIGWAPA